VLLLTGQRREEVAGMAWGELDRKAALWTIPASRAKNGKAPGAAGASRDR
jgi:integrase